MDAILRSRLVWVAFAAAAVLATAPAWSLALLGFDPTLDEALLFLCRPAR